MNTFHNEAAAATSAFTLGQSVMSPTLKLNGTVIAIEAGDWLRIKLTAGKIGAVRRVKSFALSAA